MVVLGGGAVSYERGAPVLRDKWTALSVPIKVEGLDRPERTREVIYRGTSPFKTMPTPLGPRKYPRHRSTVGS